MILIIYSAVFTKTACVYFAGEIPRLFKAGLNQWYAKNYFNGQLYATFSFVLCFMSCDQFLPPPLLSVVLLRQYNLHFSILLHILEYVSCYFMYISFIIAEFKIELSCSVGYSMIDTCHRVNPSSVVHDECTDLTQIYHAHCSQDTELLH